MDGMTNRCLPFSLSLSLSLALNQLKKKEKTSTQLQSVPPELQCGPSDCREVCGQGGETAASWMCVLLCPLP